MLALVLQWAPGAAAAAARLAVDTQPLGAVDPRFVSVTLDSGGLNRPLLQLAPRLADLGPSYFRVGGAAGDCIYWNVSNDVALPLRPPSARCKNEGSRRVASAEVVDDLLTLCSRADKLLILGLNSADGRDRTHHAEFGSLFPAVDEATWPVMRRYELYTLLKQWSGHGPGETVLAAEAVERRVRLNTIRDADARGAVGTRRFQVRVAP